MPPCYFSCPTILQLRTQALIEALSTERRGRGGKAIIVSFTVKDNCQDFHMEALQ